MVKKGKHNITMATVIALLLICAWCLHTGSALSSE